MGNDIAICNFRCTSIGWGYKDRKILTAGGFVLIIGMLFAVWQEIYQNNP